MSTKQDDPVTITAQCLCKKHSFTATVPRSSLPLKAAACHCTSCRRVTGALHSNTAAWPAVLLPPEAASKLERYVFSPRFDILFCGTCSAPMFWEATTGGDVAEGRGKHIVFTGVLDNSSSADGVQVVDISVNKYIADTVDGGASPWMSAPGGTKWIGGEGASEQITAEYWPAVDELPAAAADETAAMEPVRVRCRCEGVDLVLRPYAADDKKEAAELPWYIDPATHKRLASFDPCDSCRISAGTDIWYWTFASLRDFSFANSGSSFPATIHELKNAVLAAQEERNEALGTLALYASSAGVERYFCGRCSASVFYAVNVRPGIVDLAVGLLDWKGGARAEGLLSWNFGGDMSFEGDVRGGWREGLVRGVKGRAEGWRVARGEGKCWARVRREAAAGAAKGA